jgi:beta-galactosidase/beta-glucuronidase
MADAIEITVGDVTDVEAHVYARFASESIEGVQLRGVIRGPFCDVVRTLTADFEFRPTNSHDPRAVLAEAVVTDPCMWSVEMPHVYDIDITAHISERVVAEHRGKIGLRRMAPRRPVDFAPGTG